MIPKDMREKYAAYIASPKWKRIREKAILSTYRDIPVHDPEWGHFHCEYCQWNYKKDELEVHHLTYDSLGNEKRSHLAVVCSKCHRILDELRARKGEQKSSEAFEEARFNGWAEKVYGEDWYNIYDPSYLYDEFIEWIERRPDEW